MEIQLIRNATMRIRYAGYSLLADPYLAAKHSRPSFSGKSPNPLDGEKIELTVPA